MKTHHRAGRAILTGFGLSLLAALVFVNGCASEDDDSALGSSVEPSNAEAADAMSSLAPPGIWKCTVNSQPRSLVVLPGPFGNNTCTISATEVFGSSAVYCAPDGCLPCSYLQNRVWNCPTR